MIKQSFLWILQYNIRKFNNMCTMKNKDWNFQEFQKITKINYLNYLKTKHIIDIMLTLHSDHQRQMRSIINIMLTSEWKMIIIILQKNSVKMKDIQKKLHKLQVLYEFNECRNNELMLWEKMKSLTKMIEKLMH